MSVRRSAVRLSVLGLLTALVLPANAALATNREPGSGRMDGAVARAAGLASAPRPGKAATTPLTTDAKGRVEVYVEGEPGAVRSVVADAGGVVSDAAGRRVRAAVPRSALEEVAAASGVLDVRRPETPVPLEIISEGAQPSGALAWHADGRQGAGVKVGILDVGFGRLEAAQANGELPSDVSVHDGRCGTEHNFSHGTTVAEVVHDVAPQAQLYLACVTDSMDFDDAARWLKDQGVQVVNVSMAFPGTGRGDGLPSPNDTAWSPATVVAWLRGEGVTVIAAAGNEGDQHMSGPTADPEANGWMNIAGSSESLGFSIGAGATVTVELKWDAWPRTTDDLDLYVMDHGARPVDLNDPHLGGRYSVRAQKTATGGLSPVETVTFTNSSSEGQTYWLYVQSNGARTDLRYDLTAYGPADGFSEKTAAGSIAEPASSPVVLAVGAITAASAATGGTVEAYSSQGPSIDGRIKPDLVGYTNVSSYTGGTAPGTTKSGTSIAAAHVTGAAALYKSANPSLDPAELEAQLLDSSSRPGRSNTFGYGVVNVGASRVPQPSAGNGFTAMQTPQRVLNTNDGTGGQTGPLAAGQTLTLQIPGLPAEATAVVLDVVSTGTGVSTLEVFGDVSTGVHALDVLPGRSNQVAVATTLHPVDKVARIRNGSAGAQVIVDVLGYFSPSSPSTYFPLQRPTTLLDTKTWDVATPKLANEEQVVPVRGVAGVPSNATAVMVNVTSTDATATSYLDLYAKNPTNKGMLTAYPGEKLTKLTVVPIGDDGAIRVRGRGGEVHAAVDLIGWFGGSGGARYVPMRYTERAFDTKTGVYSVTSAFSTGHTREFRVTLQPRIPVDASAAWLTVRATSRDAAPSGMEMSAREYPRDGHPQLTTQWYQSDARTTGTAQSNGVVVPLGATGIVGIRNELGTAGRPPMLPAAPHVTVALQGYFTGGSAIAPSSLPAPTGHWKLDEASGTTAADASGRGQTVTMQGGTGWIGGRTGRATWLDGTSGFGTTAAPVLRTDQSFSVAAWVYQTQRGGYYTVVSQDGNAASPFYLQYYPTTDRWRMVVTSNDATSPTSYVAATDANPARVGEWIHLVGVYDAAAGKVKLYVNGALAGQANGTVWQANGPLSIGAAKAAGTRQNFFPRGIDEVRTYDRALVDSEVRDLHQSTSAVNLDRWAFDEGTGTVAKDSTSRGIDGTLAGGATWTTGVAGTAVQFNGTSAYVGMPGRAVLTKDSFTITAWAKPVNKTANTVLAQDGARMSPFFLQYSTAHDRWMLGGMQADADTAPAYTPALSDQPAALNQWTHLAGVYDAGARQLRLYVDGKLTGISAGVTLFNGTGGFNVGRAKYQDRYVNHFAGAIDDARTYHGVLTDAQIKALAVR
ncbi:LamG-like jellyroll fold domain-containing protein [Kribbella sp. CA-253562]|uniref:LamG-like jellyroll fold domain-containing protein n=1 Tax=Kribbella sp. CA-253562 TaxID=3239942 RepID=UPI003D938831